MTVDLQWRDAMAVWSARRAFTPANKQAGWPEAMEPQQLAALQRPWDQGDNKGRSACWALQDELVAACDAGSIHYVATTKRVMVASDRCFEPISLTQNWPAQYVRDGVPLAYTRLAEYKDVTLRHIGAKAFAAWLSEHLQIPSPHVSAWFAVRGVAWPLASGSAAGAGASPFPLVDFAALVHYRKAQKAANAEAGKPRKNIPWTDGNQLDVLHAEYERLGKNTSAAESMAKDLGTTRQAVEAALAKDWERPDTNRFSQLNAG
jgi:hypothetical protein